ncbi:hypothetical protein [Halocynthiibacter styelae]|uniref:Uncharacterized protein n=1 Tax=Halocynthiibacter styelae TaxID=2761955 RepID=A0A8J7IBZ1_9RHOB|nr:hypothetical protein [Paenihalocynthiibacter styelae]MBI1492718.1 hypothetical protein [Paenihalocynthiibacter styelae]
MTYKLKLMFEWGGGCLWCDDDNARNEFDVGPIEDKLPISQSTKEKLSDLNI